MEGLKHLYLLPLGTGILVVGSFVLEATSYAVGIAVGAFAGGLLLRNASNGKRGGL